MSSHDPDLEKALQGPLAFAVKAAQKHGYVLNPDPTQLLKLAGHLADNQAAHGKRYCPCKQHFPVQPENDPVCPCPTYRDEIATQGHCVCHLFYSPEAAEKARSRPGLLSGVTCPG